MSSLPPSPPDYPRRLRLYTWQWIGLPCIILVPVLALCGVFDKTSSTVLDSSNGLSLQVQYVSHLRYKENNTIRITVTNTTDTTLNNVVIQCDSSYFTSYEKPVVTPPAHRPCSIEIDSLPPGEQRLIQIEGKIDARWNVYGRITAATGTISTAVNIHTFVFP